VENMNFKNAQIINDKKIKADKKILYGQCDACGNDNNLE